MMKNSLRCHDLTNFTDSKLKQNNETKTTLLFDGCGEQNQFQKQVNNHEVSLIEMGHQNTQTRTYYPEVLTCEA